jgi:cobalt-zinc-cadmium resistance protein CzcA
MDVGEAAASCHGGCAYAQRRWADGATLEDGARNAAEQRFRPVLMTTLVATLGLLPAALSHGIGAQTQRPLAIVVIGGSLILAVLTRVLQPPLLVLVHGRLGKTGSQQPIEP